MTAKLVPPRPILQAISVRVEQIKIMVLRMQHRCFGALARCNVAQRCKELHSSPRCSRTRISRLEGTSSRRPACISQEDAIRVCLSVCLCVCVCVCFPYSGTSRNQAYKQQYQRLQRDTGMKYKKGFFFKTLRSEVMASFTHLE